MLEFFKAKKTMQRTLVLLHLFCTAVYSQGYICAIGGGSENYNAWSDKPYSWIVEKSDSGKIVILSTSSSDNWLADYFKSFGALEVVDLNVDSKTKADLQSNYDEIVNAKAVFIKGGDQYEYISLWKGTLVEDAVKEVFNNGGVVAGTSAGAMVLGSIDFSAKYGSVYSDDAVKSPFGSKFDLEDQFLNFVPNVLFDTHFIERGRIGRLAGFLINYFMNNGKGFLGIGIDDKTALCIDKNNIGTVFGSGSVAFLRIDDHSKIEINNIAYTAENLKCDYLGHMWKYDLSNNQIFEIPETGFEIGCKVDTLSVSNNISLSGTDDFYSNKDYALKSFIESNSSIGTCLLYDVKCSNEDEYIAELNKHSIEADFIELDGVDWNKPEHIQKINSANSIILLADDLNIFSRLAVLDNEFITAFNNKLNTNVPVLAIGNAGKLLFEFYINNTDENDLASYRGLMTNNNGISLNNNFIFQPKTFDENSFFENRVSALTWGMVKNQIPFGIALSGRSSAQINDNVISINAKDGVMIVDASDASLADTSVYLMSNARSPRQTVSLNNIRYNLSNIDKHYSILSKSFFVPTNIADNEAEPKLFRLSRYYPNPFNGQIVFDFILNVSQDLDVEVYNILGQKIKSYNYNNLSIGGNQIKLEMENSFSSGVYLIKFRSGEFSQAVKILYQK